ARIVSATSWPTVRSPGGSGGGSSGIERLEEPPDGVAQRGERVVDAPAGPIRFARRVRDRAQLDRGDAREHGRAEHAEALHGLDPPAVAAADPARGRDRQHVRLWE